MTLRGADGLAATRATRFGVRSLSVDGPRILVNGEPLFLRVRISTRASIAPTTRVILPCRTMTQPNDSALLLVVRGTVAHTTPVGRTKIVALRCSHIHDILHWTASIGGFKFPEIVSLVPDYTSLSPQGYGDDAQYWFTAAPPMDKGYYLAQLTEMKALGFNL